MLLRNCALEVHLDRSTYYQDQADRCTRLANSAVDDTTRERLLELAGEHAAMAEGLAKAKEAASDGKAL